MAVWLAPTRDIGLGLVALIRCVHGGQSLRGAGAAAFPLVRQGAGLRCAPTQDIFLADDDLTRGFAHVPDQFALGVEIDAGHFEHELVAQSRLDAHGAHRCNIHLAVHLAKGWVAQRSLYGGAPGLGNHKAGGVTLSQAQQFGGSLRDEGRVLGDAHEEDEQCECNGRSQLPRCDLLG